MIAPRFLSDNQRETMKAQMILTRFVGFAMGAVAVLTLPSIAWAHPIKTAGGSELWQGLAHPLAGWDHFCAMTAVGLWAAQRGGRAMWIVPVTFLATMALGSALAFNGVRMPLVEAGIATSLLVLGIFVAATVRLRLALGMALVSVFAIYHGHAHGTEVPAFAFSSAWLAGFVASSTGVLAFGVVLGWMAQGNWRSVQLVRLFGGVVAICGVCICIM